MKWRLMRKRARGQQNIGDYCQCVLESKVAIFIHVLESCTGDIYWWDIGGYLLVRYWRVAEEYCVFLVLPICRTDVVSPSKVPKTKQNTPVEDASQTQSPGLPGTLSADCIESVLLAMVVQYFFIFICWLFHECIRASATFLGQKPAEPKGPPRQWPSNV